MNGWTGCLVVSSRQLEQTGEGRGGCRARGQCQDGGILLTNLNFQG